MSPGKHEGRPAKAANVSQKEPGHHSSPTRVTTLADYPLMRAALAYARRGWQVFPLAPGTKMPRKGSHGLLDATTDLDQVRAWWADEPECNIGVRTGRESGIVVFDVDNHPGSANGFENLPGLEAKLGALPRTVTATSPGGSLHIFLAYPKRVGRIKSSAGQLAPGIDLRADGGFIVAAPSVIRGKGTYRWNN